MADDHPATTTLLPPHSPPVAHYDGPSSDLDTQAVVLHVDDTTTLPPLVDDDPNSHIPPHRFACLRCLCWPCLITCDVLAVLCCCCCRTKRHPTWTIPFEAAVTALRSGTHHISRAWCWLRCCTDPPLGVVPVCLGPSHVGVVGNTMGPSQGEWFYPATGARGCCCRCCPSYPGDPHLDPSALRHVPRIILYFHGGAFALCTSKTHRRLLMRLVRETGALVYCPNYRRPPEHPFPAPVDDCVACYEWLVQDMAVDPSRVLFAGDSAGGGMVLSVLAAAKQKALPMPSGGVLWSKKNRQKCLGGVAKENDRPICWWWWWY